MKTKDLVNKLRSYNPVSGYAKTMYRAADEIARLQSENDALKSKLARGSNQAPSAFISPSGKYVSLKRENGSYRPLYIRVEDDEPTSE